MSGLVLKLGPRERVLINGAVIENGDRRTRMSILTPHANILRLKDAIHPDDATTPVKKVCYIAQLALSGDASEDKARTELLVGIEQLSQVFLDAGSRSSLDSATRAVVDGQFYQALKALRGLIPREARLIAASEQ